MTGGGYDLDTLRAFFANPLANILFTIEINNISNGTDIIMQTAKTANIPPVHCSNCRRFLNSSAARKKPRIDVVHTNVRSQVKGRQAITPASRPMDAVM